VGNPAPVQEGIRYSGSLERLREDLRGERALAWVDEFFPLVASVLMIAVTVILFRKSLSRRMTPHERKY